MLTEPSIKFPWHYPSRVSYSQSISRAEQRALRTLPRPSSRRTPGRKPGPESLTKPNSEFSRQKIANSVQPWSELAILRSIKAKTHDYLRYRKARTRTTGKNVRFPLPRPRKTVRFDRQRPKPTVFRIAHPPRARARRRSGGAIPGGGAAPGQRSWPPERGPWPQGRGRTPQGEGAAPNSKASCERRGTGRGFPCMLEPLTVRKPLRAPAASRYSVRKRKRPHKATRAKEQAWKRLG